MGRSRVHSWGSLNRWPSLANLLALLPLPPLLSKRSRCSWLLTCESWILQLYILRRPTQKHSGSPEQLFRWAWFSSLLFCISLKQGHNVVPWEPVSVIWRLGASGKRGRRRLSGRLEEMPNSFLPLSPHLSFSPVPWGMIDVLPQGSVDFPFVSWRTVISELHSKGSSLWT